jgi:hypothetical protein
VEKGTLIMKVSVGVAPSGFKYLKAEQDDGHPEILLALPEFPALAPV